jgi:hypothetical protein
MAVAEIDARDPRWDALVARHPDAGAYHLSAWARILHGAYGYRPRYLAIEDADGGLRGCLPVMEMDGILGGRRLRSLPVIPAAGPLADSRGDLAKLLARACQLARESGAASLTLLSPRPGLDAVEPRLISVPKTPTWIVSLPSEAEALEAAWERPSNLRRNIARARAAPLEVRKGQGDDDLERFYGLYLATMRRHNVLPRSLRQLRLARDLLPPAVFELLLVEHEDRAIAGAVLHAFNGTVDLLYAASDHRRLDLRPNHALYRHAMRRAVERGCHRFDFGRAVPGTSLARFKAQWGAEAVPEYRYELSARSTGDSARRRRHDAIDRLAVAHGRPALVRRVWDRAPLRLTRVAGELAYRWL